MSLVCICLSALTMQCSGQRVTDPSPLTPSAGQTLTLGQMDNGLYALSPPDHTLLNLDPFLSPLLILPVFFLIFPVMLLIA